MLLKGATEDPALARALSDTGFTHTEELLAYNTDVLGVLINTTLRAHFEEPAGGWGDPIHVTRPRDIQRAEPKEAEEPDWRRLVDFTNMMRQETTE